MPRVKRSVHARKKRRKVLEQAKGYWGLKSSQLPLREGAGRALARLRLPRPQEQEADVPAALDHPHQRGRTGRGPLVQPVRARLHQGRDRARPQGARRPRRERPRRVRQDRRAGEGRAAELSARRQVFLDQAESAAGRSPLYEELWRALADEPLVDADRRRVLVGHAAAALGRPALPRARRRGHVGRGSRGARRAPRLPAALRRRAAGADERGAALLDAPAVLPRGGPAGRRRDTRPDRARPERRG